MSSVRGKAHRDDNRAGPTKPVTHFGFEPGMARVPFTPNAPPALVCSVAAGAAALVAGLPVTAALHELSSVYRYVEPADVAVPSALAMLALSYVSTLGRGGAPEAPQHRGLNAGLGLWGGAAAGIAAALGACASVSIRIHRLRGSPTDLALGALFGALFGLLCILPARELRAARHDQTHSARDVQIVNTCAWLCSVVGAAALFAPSAPWLHLAAGIALGAMAAASFASIRYALRRRWLRRVFAGTDAHWETDASSDIAPALPALELLPCWVDERTLVRVAPASGSAYRSAEQRTAAARVIPSPRW